jgi:hypothetical protein
MLGNRTPVLLIVSLAVLLIAAACSGSKSYIASNDDRASLEKTSVAIRALLHAATCQQYWHTIILM